MSYPGSVVTISVHDATREQYDAIPSPEIVSSRDAACRWKWWTLGIVELTVFHPRSVEARVEALLKEEVVPSADA